MKSNLTTLCYIEKDNQYLMLHRISKKKDINKDKWIGIGGHFEEGESPEECLLREVYEETGLTLTKWRFCGIVTFCFTPEKTSVGAEGKETAEKRMPENVDAGAGAPDVVPPICEYMHLYTASAYEGELLPCDEGELVWVKKDEMEQLPIWEGDRIFLRLLKEQGRFFSLKLSYFGDQLAEAVLDGERMTIPIQR